LDLWFDAFNNGMKMDGLYPAVWPYIGKFLFGRSLLLVLLHPPATYAKAFVHKTNR